MAVFKNINDFAKSKKEKSPISMVTCYDYGFARLVEQTDIDVILIGDSLGNAIAGYESTIPVTVDQMIYHTEIVKRGAPSKFIVCDLPFMSYHVSVEDSLRNSGRIMKETGCNAVKLEGGEDFVPVVKALVKASIPVMGHLGLTPQSVHKLGGYTVQGRDEDKRKVMIRDAKMLEDAGAFSLVLEMVPEELAKEITESISIPTIGIGGGRYCDGQVLVINDLLGMNETFTPKFLKKYADLSSIIRGALNEYNSEVKSGAFPGEKNVFKSEKKDEAGKVYSK
ncbi:MAG TPA: 3-methyl-2-oxobutanoate hydroxymethyltransferase [Spirochaetota bacterium]|nr:3-methyl-2-oxobutanoate hydroxymethyltransferase [Spirochaetota bacterium]HPS86109.1 3-methyl-2-oxobutanoate hydroxymethyltransferase [Spirochaetota bacterium]